MPDPVQSGPIIEKTTRTRVIPASEAKTVEFWPYIESLKLPDSEHLLYLYLQRDNRNIPYGQYTSHIAMRDGKLAPINDQEACEMAILKRFGGGVWRLILKKNRQRHCETRVYTGDGPTALPPVDSEEDRLPGQQPTPQLQDATTALATHAIDTVAGQEAIGIKVASETLAAMGALQAHTANVLKNFDPNKPAPEPAANPLTTQLIGIVLPVVGHLVERLLNPPDPLKQMRDTFAVIREFNPGNGTPAAPAVSAGAELVRTLPPLASNIVEGLREFRMAREAELRIIEATRGGPPQPQPSASAPRPAQLPQPTVLPPTAKSAPQEAAIMGREQGMQFVESKIVEIFNDVSYPSIEDAADAAYDFLLRMDPAIVKELATMGEAGLANLFMTRPILKPCTNDHPRLKAFIQTFLKNYAEDQPDAGGAAKPN